MKLAKNIGLGLAFLLLLTSCIKEREQPEEKLAVTVEAYLLEAFSGELTPIAADLKTVSGDSSKGTIEGTGNYSFGDKATIKITPGENYILNKLYEKEGKGGYIEENGEINTEEVHEESFVVKTNMNFVVIFKEKIIIDEPISPEEPVEEEEDDWVNPPLELSQIVDADYWREANRKAMELVTSNFAGTQTIEEAEGWGHLFIRPKLDLIMHSRILYREEASLLSWECGDYDTNTNDEHDFQKSWQWAVGLETLDGTLMEVYPPQYTNEANAVKTFPYCYITVPEGKYRMVLFVRYPEAWGLGTQWYKLPIMDRYYYQEINYQYDEKYAHFGRNDLLHQLIPLKKSPYKDMDIVEVVDREQSNILAPTWYIGWLYDDEDAMERKYPKNCQYDRHFGIWEEEYESGDIIAITTINRSNQRLKGTIVAKAEYLPFFHPDGYWRLDLVRKIWDDFHHLDIPNYPNNPIQYNTWSHEVGRSNVTIMPNCEQEITITIEEINKKWYNEGGMGNSWMGPGCFIHFYWVDEQGNETLMNRSHHDLMIGMEKVGYGNSSPYFLAYSCKKDDLVKFVKQEKKFDPASEEWYLANGFRFLSGRGAYE